MERRYVVFTWEDGTVLRFAVKDDVTIQELVKIAEVMELITPYTPQSEPTNQAAEDLDKNCNCYEEIDYDYDCSWECD